jgi:hypothetical protein
MSIYHKHHIIPKHMGGTDDPSNLIELTVEEHAEAHRKLFEQYGHWQDELAWKGLAKMIGREEIIHHLSSLGFKGKIHSVESREKISEANRKRKITKQTRKKFREFGNTIGIKNLEKANTPEARKKRKETLSKIKHQQGSKNSNYGKIWIMNPVLMQNKTHPKDQPIPDGWVKGRKMVVTVALEATHSSL